MEMFALIVYVVTDEVLRILGVEDDPQSNMSNAEVVAFAILSARFFSGNFKVARFVCLNRRIHNIVWN